ncbi:MAG: S-layer homology domain-containing protein [Bacillota bacterium]|jgi:translation initiation factor IF-1
MPKVRSLKIGLLTAVIIFFLAGGTNAVAAEQIFSDVPSGYWAESSIARMSVKGVITGYQDGTFGVYKPVSRLEMTAMIIRTMGWDSNASIEVIPGTFKDPAELPLWGKKYVAIGVNRGIISGEDLTDYRGLDFAKRYEVAQYIGKAMGMEDEAQALESERLTYTDAKDIPVGARGYVALLREQGLMTGNADGTFQPLQNVTRAEMAVLMAKLDRMMNRIDVNEIKGFVKEVGTNSLVITTGDGQGTIPLADDVYVFLEGKRSSLSDLLPWDSVTIIKDGLYGVSVEAERIDELKGTVEEITVTVRLEDGVERIFRVNEDTRIRKDGENTDLVKVTPGDELELRLDGNIITRMYVSSRVVKAQYTGKVLDVNTSRERLKIALDGEESQEITVYTDNNTNVVTIDGKISSRLSKINEGDTVVVVGEMDDDDLVATTIIVTATIR